MPARNSPNQPAPTSTAKFTATSLPLVVAVLFVGATPTYADLIVSRPGLGTPTAIYRFDETTGANLGSGGSAMAEVFRGVEVAANRQVYSANNTVGNIDVYRFAPDLSSPAVFGPPHGGPFPNLYVDHAGLTLDSQNNVYLASNFKASRLAPGDNIGIFKLDGITGLLSSTTPFASDASMLQPYDLHFGPNGHLFVSDRVAGVFEFDGVTGALIRLVVAATPNQPLNVTGIGFGPDGDLFIANSLNASVLRYDLGADVLTTFIGPGVGDLVQPADIDFGLDGDLYIADQGLHTVLRYRGSDGLALGEFTTGGATLFGPAVGAPSSFTGPEFLSFPPVPELSGVGPVLGMAAFAGVSRFVRSFFRSFRRG